jgi:hypothetical protein
MYYIGPGIVYFLFDLLAYNAVIFVAFAVSLKNERLADAVELRNC